MTKNVTIKDLRKIKKEWKERTLSFDDLKKRGFTSEEIEKKFL